jgi:hypothetical protein
LIREQLLAEALSTERATSLLEELSARVGEKKLDPYSAAEEILKK